MIESAQSMRQPLVIGSFFLPLAVATFRTGAAINIPIGVLFIAHLYGMDVTAAQLLTLAVTAVATTFSVPGIPGGSIIVMVPALLAVGLPVEGIGVLLAVDTLPDMFRTTTNVTGDLAVAALLSRHDQPELATAAE
jgi:Na+/H+-dicarboxylate symporter